MDWAYTVSEAFWPIAAVWIAYLLAPQANDFFNIIKKRLEKDDIDVTKEGLKIRSNQESAPDTPMSIRLTTEHKGTEKENSGALTEAGNEQPVDNTANETASATEVPANLRALLNEPTGRSADAILVISSSIQQQLAGIPDGPEIKDKALARQLAQAQLDIHCHDIWLYIFRSQIDALENKGTHIASRTDYKPFYDAASLQDPKFYENYSFDSWLNFLVRMRFIDLSGDQILPTELVGYFLDFVVRRQLNKNSRPA